MGTQAGWGVGEGWDWGGAGEGGKEGRVGLGLGLVSRSLGALPYWFPVSGRTPRTGSRSPGHTPRTGSRSPGRIPLGALPWAHRLLVVRQGLPFGCDAARNVAELLRGAQLGLGGVKLLVVEERVRRHGARALGVQLLLALLRGRLPRSGERAQRRLVRRHRLVVRLDLLLRRRQVLL